MHHPIAIRPFARAAIVALAAIALLGRGGTLVQSAARHGETRRAGGVISGAVTTGGSRPVRRAHVIATGPAIASTDSGSDGAFRLDGLASGRYTVAVTKTGFIQTESSTVDVVSDGTDAKVQIAMAPGGVVTGRVLDRTGAAYPDIPVMLFNGTTVIGQVTTDDGGGFRFHTLRDGSYMLWAGGVYYPSASERSEAQLLTVASGRVVDLQMVMTVTAPPYTPPVQQSSPTPSSAPQPSGTASIAGKIRSAETGSTLADVPVRLIGAGVDRTMASSDAGRFVFRGLPDGSYRIVAFPSGRQIGLSYGQKIPQDRPVPIMLAAGQEFVNADLDLPTLKTLSGRVVDDFGDPAPDVTVVVTENGTFGGKIVFRPLSGGVLTNDVGEFRIDKLPPGSYVVMALSGPFASGNVLAGPRGPAGAGAGFALTFFPGTSIPGDAQAVNLDVRGETPPISFGLVATETGTVAGRLADRSGAPLAKADVMVMQLHGGDIRMVVPARAATDENGLFTLKQIPVGTYVAQAAGRGGFASTRFAIAAGETTRPELTLAPAVTVRGRFVFEGSNDASLLTRPRISAIPTDFAQGPAGGGPARFVVNPDGTFEVPQLVGLNRLTFTVPEPWTLVRMTSGGDDVIDRALDWRDGDVDDLVVVFASVTNSVTCKVIDRNGAPLTGGVVVVFPQDPRLQAYPSRYVRGFTAGANGEFKTSALPPGVYRAVAFERAPPLDWVSPEFLATLRGAGEAFTVTYGESITVRLEVRR